MPTVREDIAQVRKLINTVNLDTRITNQFIYNKLLDVTKLIIRREANDRKIYRSTELFKTIDCITLEQDELKNCSNIWIPNCKNVMKSVEKLPKAYLSAMGSILFVYSVDKSVQFIQTTPSSYINISKREFKGNQKYFWIQDDYLIIPDSYISEVVVDGIFIDNSELNKDKCANFLDSESSIPDGVRADIIRVTASEIAGVTLRIPEDESADLNSNKKN